MTNTATTQQPKTTAPTTERTDIGMLEHLNVTVSDPDQTAAMLVDLFGWHIRWEGASIHGGRTVHVGASNNYLAVYTLPSAAADDPNTYERVGGLNHIGIVVDDLDAAEQRVVAAGFAPYNHAEYEPGRRFYFDDADGIEFEVISYRPR